MSGSQAPFSPLLATHCYACHSAEAKEVKGNLRLDSKAGWMRGGDSGPAVEPGKAEKSLLIRAVRYQDIEMPPEGRLSDAQIAVLEKWVAMGAPDPRGDDPAVCALGRHGSADPPRPRPRCAVRPRSRGGAGLARPAAAGADRVFDAAVARPQMPQ